ncbi:MULTISPECIES: BglG family transcription antiterminator [Vagococcus]|uniref:BglG family transcription antiterminator n=1 Tax=Vagococcus TaxID=2737 RepID=UPI002FC73050
MENNYNLSSDKRRIEILRRLVEGEHISYQTLSDEYFVSRSSIANDIIYIKKLFAKEGLSLNFDNSGTYFEGSEAEIQRVLKRAILNNMNELTVVDHLVDLTLMNQVREVFVSAIQKKKIDIPESYIQSIVVSILLIIERSDKMMNFLSNKTEVNKFFLEFDLYPLVYELLKEFEEQNIYQFSPEEIQYLTSLIIGSGLKFFVKDDSIPFSFRGKTRHFIQKVSEGLQTDLTQDKRLEEDLLVHLYQLVLRIEAQSTIVNPLIKDIKKKYATVYGVVWFALNDFFKSYKVTLSEDEVGFVVIHIQAALERVQKVRKILFVCPNGIGTSSFVSAKIRKILPNIDSIETVSTNALKHIELSDVDFIISTIDITVPDKKVVKISPMVTSDDMKNIMNHYIDLVVEMDQEVDSTISAKVVETIAQNILFGNFKEKNEALDYLIEKQIFENKEIKEKFHQSVYDREKIQSTYLGNGFAIPHGNPKYVEKTTISVLVLDKPVIWDNQKVDVIVLLMIREEDMKEVEAMMELVMRGITDKEWFITKMLEIKE